MRRAGVLLLVLSSLMIGCDNRDRDGRFAETVLVLALEGSTPTRSALPDETLVSDINLLIYNSEGLLEERRFLSGRQLSAADGTVRLKTGLLKGVPYDIFVAANIGYALPVLSRKDVETYRYHLAYPDEYSRGMPMSAHLDGYVNEGEAEVLLSLVRTMARIDVTVDRTKLDSDVSFQVTSVHVGNGPSSVRLFGDSRGRSTSTRPPE